MVSSALKKSTGGAFCNFPIHSPPSPYFSKTINSRPHITHPKYSDFYKYTIVEWFGGLSVFITEEWRKCLRKNHLFDKSQSRDKNELQIGKLGMKFVTRSDFILKSVKETKSLISFVFHCHLEIRNHKVMGKSKKEKTICRYGNRAILETKSYLVSQKILPSRNFSKTNPYPYEISIQIHMVLSGPQ